jgi:hypothetical protein
MEVGDFNEDGAVRSPCPTVKTATDNNNLSYQSDSNILSNHPTATAHRAPRTEHCRSPFFEHPPRWFHWQRQNVRREVEKPEYAWRDECIVWTLKDSNGFKDLDGTFVLAHDKKGFTLSGIFDGYPQALEWSTETMYSGT